MGAFKPSENNDKGFPFGELGFIGVGIGIGYRTQGDNDHIRFRCRKRVDFPEASRLVSPTGYTKISRAGKRRVRFTPFRPSPCYMIK